MEMSCKYIVCKLAQLLCIPDNSLFMDRTQKRGKMKKKINFLFVCTIVMMMFYVVQIPVQAASVKRTELTQDEENHTFSNASDGSFQYDYAVKEDYYKGIAVDENTKKSNMR